MYLTSSFYITQLEELKKDLEYVRENMEEDPKKRQHKERMRELHRDFFRVLRWQRRKLKKTLGIDDIEPESKLLFYSYMHMHAHSTSGWRLEDDLLYSYFFKCGFPKKNNVQNW